MLHKIYTVLLSLAVTVVVTAVLLDADSTNAEPVGSFSEGGVVYALDETDGVYTASASWDGTTSEVIVEASIVQNEKTYIVNKLNSFPSNSVVSKVTIKPNDNLVLSVSTFANNSNLEIIELGEGIVNIPRNFANNDVKLTSINLEHVQTIDASAFLGCKKLTSVNLNLSNVSTLGSNAFKDCIELTKITLSSELETVGNYAFKGCNALKSVTVPGGIIAPGTGMFQACKGLTNVTFDPNFKSIGNMMFEDCTALEVVDLGNVQGIGNSAFSRCSSLKTIYIPDSVKSIGNTAFQKCTSLVFCNLGSNLVSLGNQVFVNCPISGKMVIPASLTSISFYATGKPTFPVNLTEVEVDSANPVYSSKEGIVYDKAQTKVLYCPGGKTGEVVISASVDAYAFTGCHISKITILNGATTIGNAAFKADSANPTLEELILPNSLESIGNNIVSGQTKLKAIILPSTLGSLGNNTFNGLSSLEYVVFPSTAFKTTTVDTFYGVTFILADGNAVPKTTVNGTVDNLQGLRFVWDGSTAGKFYQIDDNHVLLTKIVSGVTSYGAIEKGVPFETPEAPEAPEGLTFIGWFIDPEMTVAYSEENNIVADLTLYAKFRIDTCKVNLVVDNSVKDSISGLAPGSVVTLPTEVKDGQNFNGWMIGGTLLGAQYIVSVNDADENGIIALEASFSPIEKSSWNLTVTGDVNDKAFWTVTNAIGTYGMITVLPDEFETVLYTVSSNGGYGIISDNCAMVYSKDGNDVTVTVVFQEVGKASEYDVSVAEIASGEKHGFKATVTSKDGGYVDPAGEFAISYVYKTWNDTDKVWIYTTSGVTENVSNAIVKIPTDKKVSSFTGEFLLDNDSAMLVFGFATFSFKGTSVTGTEEDVTVHSPVIMCVSEIQAVVGKP